MPGASRRFALALVAVTAAGLAVRVLAVLVIDPEVPAVGDATAYHLLATHLAEGQGYVRPFDLSLLGQVRPTAEYPPLFPGVIALAAQVGVSSVTGQRLVAGLLGTAAVAAIGLLGRRVGGPAVGLVAAGVAAVHPMLFLSDATLMPETLFVLLVAGALLAAYRARAEATLGAFATVGTVAGLAALTRAEGLLLAPLLLLPLALRSRVGARRLALAGVGLLAALAVVAPWTARNYVRFGEVVVVSNNLGTVLAGANCDATYHGPTIGFWRYTDGGECFPGFDQGALARTNEAVVARRHRTEGIAYARDNLGRLPAVATVRLLRTWGVYAPNQQAQLESLEGRPLGWQRAGMALHGVLLALAAGGLAIARRNRTRTWPLLAAAACASLTALATYGNQRFRAAAEPAVIVLAAVAITAMVASLRARRRTAPMSPRAGPPDRPGRAPAP